MEYTDRKQRLQTSNQGDDVPAEAGDQQHHPPLQGQDASQLGHHDKQIQKRYFRSIYVGGRPRISGVIFYYKKICAT